MHSLGDHSPESMESATSTRQSFLDATLGRLGLGGLLGRRRVNESQPGVEVPQAWIHALEQETFGAELQDNAESRYDIAEFKADLLLVKAGVKPAITIYRTSEMWSPGEAAKPIVTAGLHEKVAFVTHSGLSYSFGPPTIMRSYEAELQDPASAGNISSPVSYQERLRRDQVFFIAHDDRALHVIEAAYQDLQQPDQRTRGYAHGYPATAVEAYMQGDVLSDAESNQVLNDRTEVRRVYNVIPIKLSREHWQEELPVIQNYADTIKELSPAIYEEVLHVSEEAWG